MQLAGDRWSPLILRDVAMHDRRSFRDLLTGSEEGISAPLLSRRLKDLTTAGFLRKEEAPRGKQGRYSLMELCIATVPLLVALGELGAVIDPTTAPHAPHVHAAGTSLEEQMKALRARHLTAPAAS